MTLRHSDSLYNAVWTQQQAAAVGIHKIAVARHGRKDHATAGHTAQRHGAGSTGVGIIYSSGSD